MIWVAMLHAVEKLCGRSMSVPVMTVPFCEHVLEVHEVAVVHVLRVIIRVVEVDDALLVRLNDVLRQQEAARDVAG